MVNYISKFDTSGWATANTYFGDRFETFMQSVWMMVKTVFTYLFASPDFWSSLTALVVVSCMLAFLYLPKR